MAGRYGVARYHRYVYYEAVGGEPQSCFWCDQPLEWETLVIDHVDEDKLNNEIGNLVASCMTCNIQRSQGLAFARRCADKAKVRRMFEDALV